MNKQQKYLIIDENGKIIERFRGKATALQMIRELETIHLGAKLIIIPKANYEKVVQKQQEAKLKLSHDDLEDRWVE